MSLASAERAEPAATPVLAHDPYESLARELDAIGARVRADLGAVSTQAVYDCLEALTGAGLARRIEPAGHPARYEARTGRADRWRAALVDRVTG